MNCLSSFAQRASGLEGGGLWAVRSWALGSSAVLVRRVDQVKEQLGVSKVKSSASSAPSWSIQGQSVREGDGARLDESVSGGDDPPLPTLPSTSHTDRHDKLS